MAEVMLDTQAEALQVQIQLLRKMPVWRKLELMAELNKAARQLALEGLRELHPEASEAELRRYLADLLLGRELAAKAYGPHPE